MAVIELAITRGQAERTFRVEVVRSPAGEASAVIDLDVEALLARQERLEQAVLASAVASRAILPQTERPVREIGQTLFSALLGSVMLLAVTGLARRWPRNGGRGCGWCCMLIIPHLPGCLGRRCMTGRLAPMSADGISLSGMSRLRWLRRR